jgi:hypothetical protein
MGLAGAIVGGIGGLVAGGPIGLIGGALIGWVVNLLIGAFILNLIILLVVTAAFVLIGVPMMGGPEHYEPLVAMGAVGLIASLVIIILGHQERLP